MDDMVIPDKKKELVDAAQAELERVVDQYQEGLITDGERYNKIVDIWAGVADRVTEEMMAVIGKEIMTDPETQASRSKIRASTRSTSWPTPALVVRPQQMRQLAAMRGLMAKPSGEIIETPITANFREGLTVLQYFVSTHGARKGLADTALKTANSGYLTRRLVDVAQDAVVAEYDCGTLDGIRVTKLEEAGEVIQPLGDRILGRVVLEDVVDPLTGEVLVEGEHRARRSASSARSRTRASKRSSSARCSPARRAAACARMCYGRDLARGFRVNIGEAVGIIAAQSIGEPGTQLTMRTFHIGGAAARGKIEQSSLETRTEGIVHLRNAQLVKKQDGTVAIMNRHGELVVMDDTGREREHHRLVYGAILHDEATADRVEGRSDRWPSGIHSRLPILTEVGGIIQYGDLVEGVSVMEKVDEVTGLSRKIVIESRAAELRPRITIIDPATGEPMKLAEHRARGALPAAGRREHRRAGRRDDSPRRGHRQDPARHDEGAGHHRWSAARRRAVRGP